MARTKSFMCPYCKENLQATIPNKSALPRGKESHRTLGSCKKCGKFFFQDVFVNGTIIIDEVKDPKELINHTAGNS